MSPLLTGFPFTAGSAGTPKATVTATTGSPTIDTTSRVGKTIYKFTGSGTITVGVGGTCEYMVLGPGGSNGAGGYRYTTSGILPAGTLTVTIGAGTSTSGSANESRLNDIIGLGGASGQVFMTSNGYDGASGSGSSSTSGTPGAAKLGGFQGFAGGLGQAPMGPPAIGGGGGAGGVGGNAPSTIVGGNGGAGATNSITGTSTTYCAGGGGYGSTTVGTPSGAGGANTGNGGGNAAGGSGFVVVVIG
jgi:hypothetical protein